MYKHLIGEQRLVLLHPTKLVNFDYSEIMHGGRTDRIWEEPERCAIAEFFREEAKKPIGSRSNACMIVCRCKRCSIGTLQCGSLLD